MEKKLAGRHKRRRRFKRFAAGLASAAILAGASLHGIPVVRAAAADNASGAPSVTATQTAQVDKDANKTIDPNNAATNQAVNQDTDKTADNDRRDEHRDNRNYERYRHKWGDRYAHERWWYDRSESLAHRIEWYNNSLNKIQVSEADASPVDIVKAAASVLGFDADNDSFMLTSQNGSQSIVTIVHNGTSYNVTVDQLANGNWLVSFINQI